MERILLFVVVGIIILYHVLYGLPSLLKILLGFLCISLGLEILALNNLISVVIQFNTQIVAELIIISFLLQEIFTGSFDWRLSSISVIFHGMFIYAVIGFFQEVVMHVIPFGIALPIAFYSTTFLLLWHTIKRVKKVLNDYRFWILAGVCIYYLVANFVFYLEWSSHGVSQVWWIQRIAFVISMGCFAGSLISWHINKDVILTTSERFLLPDWLFKRLLYFFEDLEQEVPKHV